MSRRLVHGFVLLSFLACSTGLVLLLHLGHAGEDHHVSTCNVCQALIIGPTLTPEDQPMIARAVPIDVPAATDQTLLIPTDEHTPIASRAPPVI